MPDTEETKDLREKLKAVTEERDKYRAEYTDLRLRNIEKQVEDHEERIRPLEDGQVQSKTIYALFAGNGLMSVIVLIKLFATP